MSKKNVEPEFKNGTNEKCCATCEIGVSDGYRYMCPPINYRVEPSWVCDDWKKKRKVKEAS